MYSISACNFIDLPHLKTMPTVFFQEMEIDLLILSNIVFEFAFPKDASSYN